MNDQDRRDYVSLRDYFERILEEHCKKVEQRFESQETALDEAKVNMERRLDGLNELRQQVILDRNIYLRSDIYDEKVKYYDTWIAGVNKDITTIKTRSVTWTVAIGVFVVAIELLLHFLKV